MYLHQSGGNTSELAHRDLVVTDHQKLVLMTNIQTSRTKLESYLFITDNNDITSKYGCDIII